MKDQLGFDATTAGTLSDSDSVGAYIRASDGTLITNTTDGGKERLDVNTELGKAEDSAHSSGDMGAMALGVRNDAGTAFGADGDYVPLSMDADGALRVNATVNVDANSDYAEDSAHSSGDIGGFVLAVRQDALAASVSADGDYAAFKVDSVGSLYTKDTDAIALLTTIDADTNSIDSTLTALSKAEDSVHASGDQGVMGLTVRNDTLASLVGADGDYAPLQVNADGALYTYISGSDTLTMNDAALANTAVANASNTLSTANVAEDAVASPLANRKYLWIYNTDNQKIFVGATGVTAANGFPMSPGAYMEFRAGAAIDIEFVGSTGKQPIIKTLEFS
ncbi:MAG: hypothetical protein DRR06_16595 [Gammaproteobacteria bacterium]|nr:MAG: hypothetical protein DRR06_16595 [Gammaproteobacteria bacterium]